MKAVKIILLLLIVQPVFSQSLDERIKWIRAEYAKVNSEKQTLKTIELEGQSTEGGELKIYKDVGGNVRKLIAIYYGEMGKIVEEYYIKETQLFFAYIRRYQYNAPVYMDEQTAEEMGAEPFDDSKTKVLEYRYYFGADNKLIRYIDDKKLTYHEFDEREEQQRKVQEDFKDLMEKAR